VEKRGKVSKNIKNIFLLNRIRKKKKEYIAMNFNKWKSRFQTPNPQPPSYNPKESMQQNINVHPSKYTKVLNTNNIITPLPNPATGGKKMKWGEPIWTLFHTMAQKIDPKEFSRLRIEIIDLIRTVCNSLPCPDCTAHASNYISQVNWSTIQRKEDLINMLFVFHNTVNQRKGYPMFPREKLESTYGPRNMSEVSRVFMFHYEDKQSRGPNSAIATKFHRLRVAMELKKWFNQNIQYFNA
jgi:hypothetical protein